ncbi:MAG: efflux RND transporter periplasmic adaptor subunit [Saprospiraceae bacterium]|nr:efflux RND transporter periplasmic adaptor subunit [Saprospiraceae bacterium]MBP7680196.1 efflux RND transporter periplasmic adaptor subunit [Saprospiraceae bacterium]
MNRIILIFSTLILLFACNTNNEEQKNITTTGESNEVILTDAQVKNAGIVTATLQNNEIVSLLKVNGKIDVPPQNLVSISVPMGGYLKHTKLLPGMHVTKGDVIATIKDQQYIQLQQDYLTTKSKLHFAELEYNRQQELNLSQASSDKITQQAEAELRANQILLASLKEKLQLANINSNNVSASNITESIPIFSPINGFVTKVNANIGKYINPSEVMFELVDPTDIHLNVKVYEKDVNSLAIGKKVIAYTNANPNQKYDGKIILINKNISTDGTADVHCHFKTYDKILLPGMYMNAEIATSRSNANTLPDDAVVSFEGKNYVFVDLGKNKFRMQEIETGTTQGNYTEIKNIDIRKDQAIVTQGAYALLMKMKNTEE